MPRCTESHKLLVQKGATELARLWLAFPEAPSDTALPCNVQGRSSSLFMFVGITRIGCFSLAGERCLELALIWWVSRCYLFWGAGDHPVASSSSSMSGPATAFIRSYFGVAVMYPWVGWGLLVMSNAPDPTLLVMSICILLPLRVTELYDWKGCVLTCLCDSADESWDNHAKTEKGKKKKWAWE